MFRGGFQRAVDDKGRVILPQEFRCQLGMKFVITRGFGGCLFVMTEDYYRINFAEKFAEQPALDPSTTKLERYFNAQAIDATADAQGRVQLTPQLRAHAGIDPQSEVMIHGLTNRLEIWNLDRWNEVDSTVTEEDLALAAAEIGIARGVVFDS